MYHIKDDQRAKRSADFIYTALASLMAEKSFDSITVSDIVERGEIGRSTFYRNFDLIEDVLRWRCDCVMDELKAYLIQLTKTQPLDPRFPLLKPVLHFFYSDSTIVELLMQANRTDLLQTAFMSRFQRETGEPDTLDIPQNYLDYGAVIRSHAAVGVLVHWVKTGKKEAPDTLAEGLGNAIQKTRGRIEPILLS